MEVVVINKRLLEIEPCPFCGSNRISEIYLGGQGGIRFGCLDCGAMGPNVSSYTLARYRWNRRYTPPQPTGTPTGDVAPVVVSE